jgi:hypothetical protein
MTAMLIGLAVLILLSWAFLVALIVILQGHIFLLRWELRRRRRGLRLR